MMTLTELVCKLQGEAHNGHAMYNVIVTDKNNNKYNLDNISIKRDHNSEEIEIQIEQNKG